MPRSGDLRHMVTLDDPVDDGTPVTFSPSRIWIGLRSNGISAEEKIGWTVVCRYHPQITFNTRITLGDGRQLFVRGIDNVGDADRTGWMTLTCEEVQTP